jgi:hypothetical protein
MRTPRLNYVLLLLLLSPSAAWARQGANPAVPAGTPAAVSARIWEGHNAEFEEYMRTTPFTKIEEVPIGVTKPKRGYFEAGGPVVSAAWKVLPPGRPNGYWESYKSEIAAYELDKLLKMDMVPPVVEKRYKGDIGAAILWLKPIRPWKEVEPLIKPEKWNRQAVRMKMFDNLIGNPDRNAGNLLVDYDWNLYLIDHSRAFISDKKMVVAMVRIDRELWDRMRALDEPTLKAAIGKWVDGGEIRALLSRRDKMQGVIDDLLKKSGGNESLVYLK